MRLLVTLVGMKFLKNITIFLFVLATIVVYFGACSILEASSKFVVVGMWDRLQLNRALNYFFKIRDYHFGSKFNPPNTGYPSLIILHIAATSINSTVIVEREVCQVTGHCNQALALPFPRVLSSYTVAQVYSKPILHLWKQAYLPTKHSLERFHKSFSHSSEMKQMPIFVLTRDLKLNFLYCSLPKKLTISAWTFTLFTDPFDQLTWKFLSTSFVLVAAILIISDSRNRDISRVFILTLCATLQLGTEPISRFPALFILWMTTSLILVCFYSGEITSAVISPPQDDVITEISEMRDRNYSLNFRSQFVRLSLESSTKSMKRNTTAKTNLELFLNRSILLGRFTREDMAEFCLADGRFLMDNWALTLNFMHTCHMMVIPYWAKTEKDKARRCHVGQELVRVDEEYLVVLPPGNGRLAGAIRRMHQAGIIQRWGQEMQGMVASTRVQDRVRILGPTKVKVEEEVTVIALKMDGKSKTVFVLWLICVMISFVALGSELVMKLIRLCSQHVYLFALMR